MKLHFYHCEICGKIIVTLSDTDIPTVCCGQTMREFLPNRTDGAVEKHVPVFSVIENTVTVQVGSIPHPMTESHYITRIGLSSTHGFQFRELRPDDRPNAVFCLAPDESVEAVYAFCNLHGLWCSDKEGDG